MEFKETVEKRLENSRLEILKFLEFLEINIIQLMSL